MPASHPDNSSSVSIVFAGGGTGGHLYPALAVAEALRRFEPNVHIQFLGTGRPVDRKVVDPTGYELCAQPLVPIRRAPWHWPRIARGYRRSRLLCRSLFEARMPSCVVGTGGLSSVPPILEAARVGIPVVLLNPDAVPGRANRLLSNYSSNVFVQWEETIDRLRSSVAVTVSGCPVRSAFFQSSKQEGHSRFGLDPARKTLLITGASQGARTVNRAMMANYGFLRGFRDWQLLHLTGDADFDEVSRAHAVSKVPGCVIAYTDHMADALAVADLLVARSGASTLAEICAVGRASILMPYPFHRDRHQIANAQCLARRGAATILLDEINLEKNAPALRRALEPLLSDDNARCAMAAAARDMGVGHAADIVADHLLSLAERTERRMAGETLEPFC